VATRSVVEEVAPRPSRVAVTRSWDGTSTGLRGLETVAERPPRPPGPGRV